MAKANELEQRPNQRGLAFGLLILMCLGALLVAALREGISQRGAPPGRGNALMGLYLCGWGAVFLASYFFRYKTFLFQFLMFVCEDLSRPASRHMALFYAGLCFVLGAGMYVSAWNAMGFHRFSGHIN